jgi:hypothetical protein
MFLHALSRCFKMFCNGSSGESEKELRRYAYYAKHLGYGFRP